MTSLLQFAGPHGICDLLNLTMCWLVLMIIDLEVEKTPVLLGDNSLVTLPLLLSH